VPPRPYAGCVSRGSCSGVVKVPALGERPVDEVARAMIHAGIEAQFFHHEAALVRSAAMPTARHPLILATCPTTEPTAPDAPRQLQRSRPLAVGLSPGGPHRPSCPACRGRPAQSCVHSGSRKPGGNSSGKRSISMEFLKYLYINNWPHPLVTPRLLIGWNGFDAIQEVQCRLFLWIGMAFALYNAAVFFYRAILKVQIEKGV
jgi:hypothetical protein